MEGVQSEHKFNQGLGDGRSSLGENLAAVTERLDELSQKLERLRHLRQMQPDTATIGMDTTSIILGADTPLGSRQRQDSAVAEHLPRIHAGDQSSRTTDLPGESNLPTASSSPKATITKSPDPQIWSAQIIERQRALDGEESARIAPESTPVPAQTAATAPEASIAPEPKTLEQQLSEFEAEKTPPLCPCDQTLDALRNDLAEFGRTLTGAIPQHAISGLQAEVRALSERLDRRQQTEASGRSLAILESGMAELRDALRGLASADNARELKDAVQALSQKIDRMAASAPHAYDPSALQQIEQSVAALRHAVSEFTSDEALAQLAAEVHALAQQFGPDDSSGKAEALARLDAQMATLVERNRAAPSELVGVIQSLSECVDRMRRSPGDELALGTLEDRIAKLSEKLDASDARLKNLGAIETALADLLVHLEETRQGEPAGPHASAAAKPAAPEHPAQHLTAKGPLAAGILTLEMIAEPPQAERPSDVVNPAAAPVETGETHLAATLPSPVVTTADFQPPAELASPHPVMRNHLPIAPELPPDTPLEPGSGLAHAKNKSPAERIAASEAALGITRTKTADSGARAAAIAAARLAVQASYSGDSGKEPGSRRGAIGNWFKRQQNKAAEEPTGPEAIANLEQNDQIVTDPQTSGGKRALPRLKKMLLVASVAIIVVGSARTMLEVLLPENSAVSPTIPVSIGPSAPPAGVPDNPSPLASTTESIPAQKGMVPDGLADENANTGSTGRPSEPFDSPTTILPSDAAEPEYPKPTASAEPSVNTEVASNAKPPAKSQRPRSDATGSIQRPPLPRPAPAQVSAPAGDPANNTVPETTRSVLSLALANNEPAAEFEMATRFAEGRGVQRNLQESIRRLELAAEAGFAPAQFRLAGLTEKGEGLKKDLHVARRLYLAAAAQGHARAMHNLAVLFAEGIDGKPDFKAAAQWFRKAASYGITDSQYNLGILYARGVGLQANLVESYKWFALAAAKGDEDAARKRDEVASRLDPQMLMAARLAVQTFAPEHEPEAATSLRVPPGGWDRTSAATSTPQAQAPRRQRG
jgi:localization factor PodJL